MAVPPRLAVDILPLWGWGMGVRPTAAPCTLLPSSISTFRWCWHLPVGALCTCVSVCLGLWVGWRGRCQRKQCVRLCLWFSATGFFSPPPCVFFSPLRACLSRARCLLLVRLPAPPQSGISVSDELLALFETVKMASAHKYIIFSLKKVDAKTFDWSIDYRSEPCADMSQNQVRTRARGSSSFPSVNVR